MRSGTNVRYYVCDRPQINMSLFTISHVETSLPKRQQSGFLDMYRKRKLRFCIQEDMRLVFFVVSVGKLRLVIILQSSAYYTANSLELALVTSHSLRPGTTPGRSVTSPAS